MTNTELLEKIFDRFMTEIRTSTEKDFLEWLKTDMENKEGVKQGENDNRNTR